MEIDVREVAKRVVKDVLRLQEPDCLHVEAWEHTIPLAKEIIKEARRAGADTLLTVDADDVWYDALMNLPEDWLRVPSTLQQAVRRGATALVYTGGIADPEGMKSIPDSRWRSNSEGAEATYKPFEDSPIPSVSIELGMVTEARAKNYGFDYQKWYGSVLASLGVSPSSLRQAGEPLAKALKGAEQGRLTAPGGTDFEFEFHEGDATIFTGEVRPVEGKKSSYQTSLPAGSISFPLRQGSGEGRVVSTAPIAQMGDFIRGLTWEFSEGRVTRVDAQEHLDLFETHWTEEKRKKGADQLGYLVIGLNPEARFGFLGDSLVQGAVSVAIGNNEWLGGSNDSDYDFPISFRDADLDVDGRRIVEAGRILPG